MSGKYNDTEIQFIIESFSNGGLDSLINDLKKIIEEGNKVKNRDTYIENKIKLKQSRFENLSGNFQFYDKKISQMLVDYLKRIDQYFDLTKVQFSSGTLNYSQDSLQKNEASIDRFNRNFGDLSKMKKKLSGPYKEILKSMNVLLELLNAAKSLRSSKFKRSKDLVADIEKVREMF